MDPARWDRLQELFQEAADRPAPERLPYLQSAAGGDSSLIDEVLEML